MNYSQKIGIWLIFVFGLTGTAPAQAFLGIEQVSMSGLLGYRYQVNLQNRLLWMSEETLLRPFRQRGPNLWDGEYVGKWLHASVLTWVNTRDADLKAKIDRIVQGLLAQQEADGYLGTYDNAHRWSRDPGYRWDVWTHKYVLIGLITYYRATGDAQVLSAARNAADLLTNTFGRESGQLDVMLHSSHTGLASASILQPMVWLYQETKESRYLDFCRYVIWAIENSPSGPRVVSGLNTHGQVELIGNGKAYEMLSVLAGMMELAGVLGAQGFAGEAAPLLSAVQNAYQDITQHSLYVTGSCSWGEFFQPDGLLPNAGNAIETCVTVTFLQLCQALYRHTGDSLYMSQMEQIIYNHLLAAQHPDGNRWCYFTPLEGKKPYSPALVCCSASGPRGIAMLPELIYEIDSRKNLTVNLFASSRLTDRLSQWDIQQKTNYPYEGEISLHILRAPARRTTLRVRIPDWCQNAVVLLNGLEIAHLTSGGYYPISRTWRRSDLLKVRLEMPLRIVPGTGSNSGKLTLQKGPLVLAVDQRFLPAGVLAPKIVTVPSEDPSEVSFQSIPLNELWQGETGWDTDGKTHAQSEPEQTFSLRLIDFMHAGATSQRFAVWLPRPSLPPIELSLFAYQRESRSRSGDLVASINDEEPYSWCVTRNNQMAAEDWFAVERDDPVFVKRIVYIHGNAYSAGGWFDASAGKPRIQIKRTPESEWETIAILNSYPNTTATGRRTLTRMDRFEVILSEAVSCVGLRIIGKPATGSSPNQAFSSCAELQGFSE